MRKAEIRKEMLKKLKGQDKKDRLNKSLRIKERLFSLSEFKKAKVVMFYVSMDGEVNTIPMVEEAIREGKRVLVPAILKGRRRLIASQISDPKEELNIGPYGVPQPKPSCLRPFSPKEIDLVIVPGIAFDEKGNRLGRGAGYYDRFLKGLPKEVPLIGLAFDFQIVKDLPRLAHDVRVSKVIAT